MKKSIVILICLLVFGAGINAQSFYGRGGLGITVTTAANISTTSQYHSSEDPTSVTGKKEGLGTGIPIVLAAGYKLNPNFGFELGIDYFIGFSTSAKSESDSYSVTLTTKGQMLSLVPAVFFTFPLHKFNPYARLGLKLGIVNRVFNDYTGVSSTIQQPNVDLKNTDYGGVAMGVQAAIGTDYALDDMFSIFGEIQIDGISYSPTHGKYTVYKLNGKDYLGQLDANDKTWNYLKEIDNTKNIPSDQPDEKILINNYFGNFGLIVGVKISIFNE